MYAINNIQFLPLTVILTAVFALSVAFASPVFAYDYGNYSSSPLDYGNYSSTPFDYGNYSSSPFDYGNYSSAPFDYGSYDSTPFDYGNYSSTPYDYGSYDSYYYEPYDYDYDYYGYYNYPTYYTSPIYYSAPISVSRPVGVSPSVNVSKSISVSRPVGHSQPSTPSNTTNTTTNIDNSINDSYNTYDYSINDSYNTNIVNSGNVTPVYTAPQQYTATAVLPPTYYSTPTYPTYQPTYYPPQYVALSQIPYTGLDIGVVGNTLYWIGLVLFALALGYLAVYYIPALFRVKAIVPARVMEAPIEFAKSVADSARSTKDSMAFMHSKDGSAPQIVIARS